MLYGCFIRRYFFAFFTYFISIFLGERAGNRSRVYVGGTGFLFVLGWEEVIGEVLFLGIGGDNEF